ncbi:hypothetical protein M9H77_12321 [Catharanthus roseus]|uniref:Uncharacterized protein n=1 Tax=Catharanthus roseus TaxID=4058 RepID=A0ACC0BH56_CATRO|nr:hypothetical protein M9H77_12321 [Catharanthus roseus]
MTWTTCSASSIFPSLQKASTNILKKVNRIWHITAIEEASKYREPNIHPIRQTTAINDRIQHGRSSCKIDDATPVVDTEDEEEPVLLRMEEEEEIPLAEMEKDNLLEPVEGEQELGGHPSDILEYTHDKPANDPNRDHECSTTERSMTDIPDTPSMNAQGSRDYTERLHVKFSGSDRVPDRGTSGDGSAECTEMEQAMLQV